MGRIGIVEGVNEVPEGNDEMILLSLHPVVLQERSIDDVSII